MEAGRNARAGRDKSGPAYIREKWVYGNPRYTGELQPKVSTHQIFDSQCHYDNAEQNPTLCDDFPHEITPGPRIGLERDAVALLARLDEYADKRSASGFD